ncbi:MAG: restriction endonuclease subunit S [Clostridiaceae bacterium]|jgi:putative type I restriction enzyme specificity protein|nr:restriction endonuclease subunit S [Clostridiaceae bacterium]
MPGLITERNFPTSWTIKRFKYCAQICNGGEYSDIEVEEGGYPVIGSGGEFARASKFSYCGKSVLLGRKGTVDKPLFVDGAFWCVDTMFYTKIKDFVYEKYLYYCALCFPFDYYVTSTALPSMTQRDLGSQEIAVPPKKEQKAIADFLDKECAQIDSIAADLEKQIALLQQYKKSLIAETVTKGLDNSVPMKDSGVEWIGEIPVGWELSRIKYLTDNHHPYPIGDGDHGMIKADDYLTEGIPYIRVLNLTWGSGLNLENLVFISKEMNSLIKNSELKPNDILIAKTGATIGKTAIVPDSLPVSNTTSHVGKITLANVHDAKYFYYVMTSSIVQKQIQDISAMQSTRPELGIEGLKNLILTVPPFDIQQHIARFLDDHCAKIDRVLHEKGKQLSVIKQHKKSLIYEYVTGKKRVKEVR